MSKENWFSNFQYSTSEKRGIFVLIVLCLLSAVYCYTVPEIVHRRQMARFEREVLSPHPAAEQMHAEHPHQEGQEEKPSGQPAAAPGVRTDRTVDQPVARRASIKETPVAERPVRINTASAAEILRSVTLPPAIAYRIVRFREGAGGFYSITQLRDVYELTDSLYRTIAGSFLLDTVALSRINVNTASAEELMEHPYISRGLAAQIVNFREKVAPYRSQQDLLRLYFMDEVLLDKLLPYIIY